MVPFKVHSLKKDSTMHLEQVFLTRRNPNPAMLRYHPTRGTRFDRNDALGCVKKL
jgi:hypothetical protein